MSIGNGGLEDTRNGAGREPTLRQHRTSLFAALSNVNILVLDFLLMDKQSRNREKLKTY